VPRTDAIRAEIHRLIRAVPFRRFLLILASGDRVLIEHPENIAFDPEATFGAVSSISLADRDGAAA
jgi:hypothetical protein